SMNPLTSELRKLLQDVLTQAFNRNELFQLATVRLDFPEAQFADLVNFDNPGKQIAFDLVEAANRRGYVEQLVRAVEVERPGSCFGVTMVEPFGLAPAQPGRPAPPSRPGPVRDAVIRFNERFQQRQKLFRYLNAYKQLHDLLHELQDFQEKIRSAPAAARQPA